MASTTGKQAARANVKANQPQVASPVSSSQYEQISQVYFAHESTTSSFQNGPKTHLVTRVSYWQPHVNLSISLQVLTFGDRSNSDLVVCMRGLSKVF